MISGESEAQVTRMLVVGIDDPERRVRYQGSAKTIDRDLHTLGVSLRELYASDEAYHRAICIGIERQGMAYQGAMKAGRFSAASAAEERRIRLYERLREGRATEGEVTEDGDHMPAVLRVLHGGSA